MNFGLLGFPRSTRDNARPGNWVEYHSHSTGTGGTSFVKVDEVKMARGGRFLIGVSLSGGVSGTGYARAQIRKNGIIFIDNMLNATGTSTFNFERGIKEGDVMSLWLKKDTGANAYGTFGFGVDNPITTNVTMESVALA